MPIRFRCPYCNQLLGIARRKAGTEVQCPTCRNAVAVPQEEEEAAAPSPAPAPAAPPVFEREDFSALLKAPPALPSRPAPLFPAETAPPGSLVPGQMPPPEGGLIISTATATILTVVLILLLALAFGAGLLVGRFYLAGG